MVCVVVNYEYCVPLLCTIKLYASYCTLFIWTEYIIVLWLTDNALCTHDYKTLCKLLCVEECEDLITTSSSKLEEVEKPPQYIAEGLVVDNEIQVKYANVLEQYKEKLNEDFEYSCSSCKRLHKRSYVTKYTAYTQKFDSDKWVQLKQYLVDRDDDFDNKIYYVCQHCRPLLNNNKIPSTCVLNGL